MNGTAMESTRQALRFEQGQAFRALHTEPGGFIIPNPWDAGTAMLLELLGFRAIATTSAGFSFSRARPDNALPRGTVIRHLAHMTAATSLPVSADLGNGFGDAPEIVAQTILLAAQAGVVGGSLEDSTGRPSDPFYEIDAAADRIRAAAEAARTLPFPFTLTARAENHFLGRDDLPDTIRRLQAFQEAGADVLFAPGLVHPHDIETVLQEIDRPLNVIIGLPKNSSHGRAGMTLGAHELFALGVKRVSVGGSLARAALGEFMRAATELRDFGTDRYADSAISASQLNKAFGQ